MRIFNTGQISPSEKQDILDKHRTLYNGFRTMEPKVSNEQPLYIQDFAGDKLGMTINNKGEVKKYTNFGINESIEEGETCEQCGGQMNEGICEQCGSGEMEEGKGHLDDIYDEEDLNPSDDFDYVEGGGNNYGTFEKMHHMKEGTATSNAPVSLGKHYDEIKDPYSFQSNGPVGNGKTLRMSNVDEQGRTGGGNAPDFDFDLNADPAFDFKSKGPKEGDGPFNVDAPDMDLDTDDEKKPYDFQSGGPDNGGEVYPVFEDSFDSLIDMDNELENEREELEEDDFEEFTSAFDDEIDEVDVSGSQGIYGDMDPAYDFDSEGPGSAGPYQTRNEGETEEQYLPIHVWDDAHKKGHVKTHKELGIDSDDDFEEGELEVDFDTFDPRDKSWEEITAHTGDDEFGNVDEDLRESLINQKNKINEMFLRMKVIK